ADDVLFGLEVVIERGLGDAEPFRDLPQRGLLVALLGEQLQRDCLDALPGAAARQLGTGAAPGAGLPAGRGGATGAAPAPGAAPAHRGRTIKGRPRGPRGGAHRLIHHAAPRTPSANLLDDRLVSVLALSTKLILTGRQVGSEHLARGGTRAMAQNTSAEAAAVPTGPRREVLIILPGLLLAIMLAMLDQLVLS